MTSELIWAKQHDDTKKYLQNLISAYIIVRVYDTKIILLMANSVGKLNEDFFSYLV